ncbi:MAG: DUF3267 domain-containing protein [Saprospiraceae bacterium]|nr:DUF3267 domain-containing protein [Candidatus Parvibacillus calidus]
MPITTDIPEGYERIKKTIDIYRANIYGFLILIPVSAMYLLPYYLVWQKIPAIGSILSDQGHPPIRVLIYTIVALVAGVVLHELIHGITWSFFTRHGFRSIRFGIMSKALTPYCHCKEPLSKNQYILGAIMPSILLGVIPGIWAIAMGNAVALYWGVFFTIAAVGDFMIISLIRKDVFSKNFESISPGYPINKQFEVLRNFCYKKKGSLAANPFSELISTLF